VPDTWVLGSNMSEPLSPFNPKDFKEAVVQLQQYFEDLYDNRLAGASPGDVIGIDNTDDSVYLALKSASGLDKTGGELSVLPDPAGPITVTSDGVNVSLVSNTKKGVVPILPADATKYLDGTGVWTVPSVALAATTVKSETTFGIAPDVGTDVTYAREDHTHGTPPNPVSGSSGTIHLAKRTITGTEGTITVSNGLITGFVDPT
jgi:hypothetical protein